MDYTKNAKDILARCLPEDETRLLSATDTFIESVLLKALSLMPEEKVPEFWKLIQANPAPEAVASFCSEHVVDFQAIVKEQLAQAPALTEVV